MSTLEADDLAVAELRPVGSEAEAESPRKRKLSLGGITARLTASNISIALVGIVTGPLQARALGPAGRGDLAAILTPFAFLPSLASIGLGSYAIRAVANGRRPGTALGSLLPASLAIGLVVALTSPLLAGLLAGGRAVVYTMLVVGFVTFPIGMITNMLIDVSIGLEDWRPVMAFRIISPAVQLVCIPTLFILGRLTVTSAALVTFAAGILLFIPVVPVFRASLPLRFDRRELRAGIAFGAKSWLGGLGNIANARLDQLLMIRLVAASVLGEYAVAVTLSNFVVSPVVGAITVGANARLARGEEELTRRLCRLAISGAAVVGLGIGATAPFVLHYVFGPAFDAALPMTLILLVATLPSAGGAVLESAISARGNPGIAARSEILSLAVTVPGLALALPTLGGVGAALVSVVAYSTQFGYMLRAAKRIYGGTWGDYLLPTSGDARTLAFMCLGRLPKRFRRMAFDV